MGLRDRREHRRQEREAFGRRGNAVQYRMRQKLVSIGNDYWIEDAAGERVFRVDGKALRLRDTWVLKDISGQEVAKIRERKLSLRDALTIDIGDRHATVKKAFIGIRDRFHVEVDGGQDLKVHGNVVDHEYEIERDGRRVATISKKWFRIRDTYGVAVQDPVDVPLALSITVAVDALAHDRG